MIPAKIYPVVIPANETLRLAAQGDFFKVLNATGLVEVTGDTFGTIGGLRAGHGLDKTPFTALTLRDLTGAANTVEILVADERFIDDRVTGEVSVIDGGKSRTLAGQVFGGRFSNSAAAPGNRNWAQWMNPAASTKRMIVSSWSGMGGANGVIVGITTVAFTNLHASNATNKLSGSAVASVSEKRYQQGVGVPAPFDALVQCANGIRQAEQEPIIIMPGYALAIVNADDASALSASIHWTEESL